MGHLFVILTVVLTVLGQLIIKWQVGQAGISPTDAGGFARLVGRLLLEPWVLAGLGAAFVASLLWMLALTKLDLSEAYPYTALSFVLVMLASRLVFAEPLTTGKILGTALIVSGIVVLALTTRSA